MVVPLGCQQVREHVAHRPSRTTRRTTPLGGIWGEAAQVLVDAGGLAVESVVRIDAGEVGIWGHGGSLPYRSLVVDRLSVDHGILVKDLVPADG